MTLSVALVARGGLGGSSAVAAELALALDAAGHRVALVAAAPVPRLGALPGERAAPAHRVREVVVPVGAATRAALVQLAREQPLDLVHVHYAGPHLGDALAAAEALAPRPAVVVTLHGSDVPDPDDPRAAALRARLARCDRVLVPSPWLQREAQTVAPGASCSADFTHVDRFVRRDALVDQARAPKRPIALYVGHLEPWKGPDVLLEAVRSLPGVRARLIGGGSALAELSARARTLPDGAVEFAGPRAVGPSDFAAGALVVVPSRREAFGLVALEALAAGRALVATAVGGLAEWLEPFARAGRVTFSPPDDPGALAAAMRAALDRHRGSDGAAIRAAEAESAAATRRLLDRYDRPAGLARHLAVYEEVLRSTSTPRADPRAAPPRRPPAPTPARRRVRRHAPMRARPDPSPPLADVPPATGAPAPAAAGRPGAHARPPRIQLDHNATTPLREEARRAWLEAIDAGLGNPSSLHDSGRRARHAIDAARERVAAALGVHEDHVLFTSGGTEAINLALRGHLATRGPGAALASAPTEHAAVRETAAALARAGHPHHALAIEGDGELDAAAFERVAAAPHLALVVLSAGNHELGTVHDLRLARERLPANVRLATDAVQALGRVPIDLDAVDFAAFSAHKVGGPAGVGVLVARAPLAPIVFGGGQERGLRPGTEPVAEIAAAAVAIELAVAEREDYARRTRALAHGLWTALASRIPGIELAGPPLDRARRLPNTLCLLLPRAAHGGREHDPRIPGDGTAGNGAAGNRDGNGTAGDGIPADGKVLVTRLDLAGLEVSAGSACASGSIEPSPVLLALGIDEDRARAALRVSLGRKTTADECQRAADVMVSILAPSRASRDGPSPL